MEIYEEKVFLDNYPEVFKQLVHETKNIGLDIKFYEFIQFCLRQEEGLYEVSYVLKDEENPTIFMEGYLNKLDEAEFDVSYD